MKSILSIFALASVLSVSSVAHATTYTVGTHVFEGSGFVEKDNGPFACDMTLTIVVSSATVATASSTLTGSGGICDLISITPSSLPVSFDPSSQEITFGDLSTPVYLDPPLSSDCSGTLTGLWGGNLANPRSIDFSSAMSDIPAVNPLSQPCKISMNLTQVSPSPTGLTIN